MPTAGLGRPVETTRRRVWNGIVGRHLIHARVFTQLSLNAKVHFDNLSINETWVMNARCHAMWLAGFFRFTASKSRLVRI